MNLQDIQPYQLSNPVPLLADPYGIHTFRHQEGQCINRAICKAKNTSTYPEECHSFHGEEVRRTPLTSLLHYRNMHAPRMVGSFLHYSLAWVNGHGNKNHSQFTVVHISSQTPCLGEGGCCILQRCVRQDFD